MLGVRNGRWYTVGLLGAIGGAALMAGFMVYINLVSIRGRRVVDNSKVVYVDAGGQPQVTFQTIMTTEYSIGWPVPCVAWHSTSQSSFARVLSWSWLLVDSCAAICMTVLGAMGGRIVMREIWPRRSRV